MLSAGPRKRTARGDRSQRSTQRLFLRPGSLSRCSRAKLTTLTDHLENTGEIVLRHGPIEGHALTGAFLQRCRNAAACSSRSVPPSRSEIAELYVGRCVPDEHRRPGAQNPIRYTW